MSSADLPFQHRVGGLYREHHRWLTAWLYRRVGCSEQARDLAQDTFLRVLRARTAPDLREPRAYLARIAQGLSIDWLRRRHIEQAYLEALAARPPGVEPSVEERQMILDTLFRIETFLESLGPRARQIFVMAQIEGLSYPEIGHRLGVSVTTVKKHLVRALAACAALVET